MLKKKRKFFLIKEHVNTDTTRANREKLINKRKAWVLT